MSDWGEDDYTEVPAAPGPDGNRHSAPTPVPDTPEVARALQVHRDARRDRDRAAVAADDAQDARADAEGVLRVAEAKNDDYAEDENKATWQLVAAAEDVEKARRQLARRQAVEQRRTTELAAAQAALGQAADELDDTIVRALAAGTEDEPAASELYYGSVDEFVREYLRNVYRRAINGRNRVWAARWWEYDEAVIRLEALWRAWEHLRQDAATGASVWWRDHADHHMSVLMDPDGPFAAADPNAGPNQARKGAPLPYEAPPAGLFPDVRSTDGGTQQ